MRRSRPIPAREGFTLLEVMVALSILAAALLAVSELTAGALRNHGVAVRLEVATLLARGKLASLEDGFDKDGFRDFDQTDDGTFEKEGHPEVSWKVEVVKPKIELGPEQILALLTGMKGEDGASQLATLLGAKATSSDDAAAGLQSVFPGAAGMMAPLQAQLSAIGEELKKGVREVRLTVAWKDGHRDESFTVVTHLVSFAQGTAP